ncbi:MAG: LytTR family DNA-binding domain-containing protein [Bacteroidota bacterium]
MKLRTIIVDDEPIARQIIQQYAVDDTRLEISASCKNALEVIKFLQHNTVDLIFLDINMPKLTGLDMMRTLQNPPMVIFTTAYREYAVEGFELAAIDYLVKPFSLPRFLQAINRAVEKKTINISVESTNFFFIKADGKNIKVHYDDIIYIEAMSEYIRIHTHTQKITTLQSLRNMESKLPAEKFLRVHRSYLVSLDKIEATEGNQILIGDAKIPVSKSYREALARLIKKHNL